MPVPFQQAISDMSGGSGGGGGGADELARTIMDDLLARLPENFVMVILHDKAYTHFTKVAWVKMKIDFILATS